jgi:hypothetical protein
VRVEVEAAVQEAAAEAEAEVGAKVVREELERVISAP